MSPEPTGVHGLLKQRKLFTHKSLLKSIFLVRQILSMKRIHMNFKECVMCYFSARFCCNSSIRDSGSLEYSMIFDIGILSFNIRIAVSSLSASLASSFDSSSSDIHAMYSRLHSLFSLAFSTSSYSFFVRSLWVSECQFIVIYVLLLL